MYNDDICVICGRQLSPLDQTQSARPGASARSTPEEPVMYACVSVPEGGDEDGDIAVCEKCYGLLDLLIARGCDPYEVHYEFGLSYSNEDRKEEAAECFRRALAVERTPDALAMLAVCLQDPKEEERLLREALKLDPENELAQLNLQQLLGLHVCRNDEQTHMEPQPVKPITFPVLGGDTAEFPSDRPVCPMCGCRKVWEPHSMACLDVGALLMDRKDDSGGPSDDLDGYFDLTWHGAHDGGQGEDRDMDVHLPIVRNIRGGQADLYFCSTQCLRQFLNSCVDELERRIAAESA